MNGALRSLVAAALALSVAAPWLASAAPAPRGRGARPARAVDFPLYGVFNIARIQTAKVKIIHCSERKQIVEELYREALEKDVENAKKHFWGLKEQFPDEYDFSREQLVMLGKRFRIEKRYEEAIDTYTWVTELYPEWWGGYHGLAEVQGIVGMKEYAIAGYGKSLELNPTKSHAKIATELLKELIKP